MKLHSLRDSRSSVEWIPVFRYMWMWSNPLTNQPSRGTLRRRHPAHEPAMIRWYLEKEAGYLDWVGGGTPPTFAVAAVRCGGSQKSVVLIAALPGGNEILDVLRCGVHILSHSAHSEAFGKHLQHVGGRRLRFLWYKSRLMRTCLRWCDGGLIWCRQRLHHLKEAFLGCNLWIARDMVFHLRLHAVALKTLFILGRVMINTCLRMILREWDRW